MDQLRKNTGGLAESRAAPRTALPGLARLLLDDARHREIISIDISLGGMGILVDEALETGKECILAFDAPVDNASRRINIWGKVVYCRPSEINGFRIGIRFRDADVLSKMHIAALCEPAFI